jgi:hypothetical protein
MIKDGVEYFVHNRPISEGCYSPEYHLWESEHCKAILSENGGSHFKFHGIYENPEEMIAEMLERGHTFVEPKEIFQEVTSHSEGSFVDFSGNRNEVSAAFCYRIYDCELIEKLRAMVQPIIQR